MRLYANYSHSVFDSEDGTYEVCFSQDDILVEDGFTTLDGAIAYANLHETR